MLTNDVSEKQVVYEWFTYPGVLRCLLRKGAVRDVGGHRVTTRRCGRGNKTVEEAE